VAFELVKSLVVNPIGAFYRYTTFWGWNAVQILEMKMSRLAPRTSLMHVFCIYVVSRDNDLGKPL
jgi:hypothetical protein